jgi:hypothetical protein
MEKVAGEKLRLCFLQVRVVWQTNKFVSVLILLLELSLFVTHEIPISVLFYFLQVKRVYAAGILWESHHHDDDDGRD